MSPICTRREFLRTLGAGAAFVSLQRARVVAQAGSEKQPNIVLIMADDMGYSDIGCYGGTITREIGHLINVMATCLDVAGAEYPREVNGKEITPPEGKSLLPIFEGRDRRGHDALFWEHEGNRALRQGKWKLVAASGKPWELYDLEADRTERNNLAAKHPERVDELKALYEAWATRCGVQPWPLKKPKS